MRYNPELHHRRSIRLREWDYATPGAYAVTLCTYGRAHLFGKVADGKIELSDTGRMIQCVWLGLPEHLPGLQPDSFVIMPNHIHAIVLLGTAGQAEGRGQSPARTSLSDLVRRFKTLTTRLCGRGRLWQRNDYEHIVRNDEDLIHARRYIEENVARWATDPENLGRNTAGGRRAGTEPRPNAP